MKTTKKGSTLSQSSGIVYDIHLNRAQKILDNLIKFWDNVPIPVKILIYQCVAGLLNMGAQRVFNIESKTPELLLVLQTIGNILLWGAQWITKTYIQSVKIDKITI